jgi:hypothetical protein
VHGALGEEGEDGGADISAARPGSSSTAATAVTESAIARELLTATVPGMARMAM